MKPDKNKYNTSTKLEYRIWPITIISITSKILNWVFPNGMKRHEWISDLLNERIKVEFNLDEIFQLNLPDVIDDVFVVVQSAPLIPFSCFGFAAWDFDRAIFRLTTCLVNVDERRRIRLFSADSEHTVAVGRKFVGLWEAKTNNQQVKNRREPQAQNTRRVNP